MTRWSALAFALAVAAGLGWLWLGADVRAPQPFEATALRDAASGPGRGDGASAPAAEDPLPSSLRGTSPSGDLLVDADGHFAPTREALLFFEYYLSASHEEPLPRLVERMRRAIRARLVEPAASEAEAFLERYLDYRERGAAEFDDPRLAESADLERRVQWLREFRRAHFGAELAETLFGDEADALEVRLAMRRIGADPTLDDEERRRQLAALEERHPERVREARDRASLPLRHAIEERRLREDGAREAEIQALRERRFGAEAAERMAALDRERADWSRRLAAYRAARSALEPESLDTVEREDSLDALRAEHFDPAEIERVRLLDRVEALERPHAVPTAD